MDVRRLVFCWPTDMGFQRKVLCVQKWKTADAQLSASLVLCLSLGIREIWFSSDFVGD